MEKDMIKEAKSFFMTVAFAVLVLIFVVSMINPSNDNLVGRAFYEPVRVYGEVSPDLPDGTAISFRIGRHLEVASSTIKDNKYGYNSEIIFAMDNLDTDKIEGYAQGYRVNVYIENVEIVEWSYFEGLKNKKDITIAPAQREAISRIAAESEIERNCINNWVCGEWSMCENNRQSRKCKDMASCGNEIDKPREKRNCASPGLDQPKDDISLWKSFFIMIFIFLLPGLILRDLKKQKK